MAKVHRLPFLGSHRQTFELIRDGRKRLETRAGSKEYFQIAPGDSIEFSCGEDMTSKKVVRIEKFPSLESLLTRYQPADLNPAWGSSEEARQAFLSFPRYEKRIQDFGLLVFEIEENHE